MFGVIAPPLNASVRLPIVVPHGSDNARMNSAFKVPLRFRGRRVAVMRAMRSGIQAVTVVASFGLASAACGRRRLFAPRSSKSRRQFGFIGPARWCLPLASWSIGQLSALEPVGFVKNQPVLTARSLRQCPIGLRCAHHAAA